MNDRATHFTLMPTLLAVHERRAVRSYTTDPVSDADIDLLLDAAAAAPSAMNSQPWAFVVLQDAGLLARCEREAAEYLLSEPPRAEVAAIATDELELLRALVSSPDFTIFHGAPAVIVIYATSAHGIPDCYLAAENILLGACALGLGTCPIGLAIPLFNRPEIKAEFDVPPEYVVALPITIGLPSGPTHAPPHSPAKVLARR